MVKRIRKFTAPSPDTVEIVADTFVGALTGNVTGTATQTTGITESSGPTALTLGAIADNEYVRRVGNNLLGGTPTGSGDTISPATNSADYVPQWNGSNSKTLKNGYPVSSTAGASTIPVSDGSGKIDTWVSDASDTVKGKVELAIASEVTTGTSTSLAVTPDALAGSSIFGVKSMGIYAVEAATDLTVTDGVAYFPPIPPCLNGMNLITARASVMVAGTTNATTIDIYNVTDSQDMLSSAISIASGATVGTGTVNTSYDDVVTNDILRADVSSISNTPPKGLSVTLEFQLP